MALVQWFYFVAIDRLPVGIALLLQFTAPVLVALFVRFVYREPVRPRIWLGIGLSLAGLALVAEVWSGLALDGLGVLAGLGAAVSLATYFLIGERSVSAGSPLHVLTEAFIVAAVFWNVLSPGTRVFDTDLTSPTSLGGTLSDLQAPVWVLFVWMVLLGTAIPFLAELTALQHLTATEVTLVGMLEPVGATFLGLDLVPADSHAGSDRGGGCDPARASCSLRRRGCRRTDRTWCPVSRPGGSQHPTSGDANRGHGRSRCRAGWSCSGPTRRPCGTRTRRRSRP